MIQIKIQTSSAVKYINNIATKKISYATASALNELADMVKYKEMEATGVYFDRPVPFTRQSFWVKKASKNNHVASILPYRVQGRYLQWQIYGGQRLPKNKAIPVPVHAPLDRYGNMPNKSVKAMLKDKQLYFSGTPRGWQSGAPPGIWRRMGTAGDSAGRGKLELQVAWDKRASYRPLFPFYGVGRAVVSRNMHAVFIRALSLELQGK